MKNLKNSWIAPIILVALMLTAGSCTKDNSLTPAAGDQASTSEVMAKKPSAGTYMIAKFTDTGEDKTSKFNGYTFDFGADGSFIAHAPNGQTFNGSWSMNSAETIMAIAISGSSVIKNLDDDNWSVVKISNLQIKIKKPGPDIVIFKKI